MIHPLRFFAFVMSSEVETSLTIVSLRQEFPCSFGRNDKMVIRHRSEHGDQNAFKRDPAARFAAA